MAINPVVLNVAEPQLYVPPLQVVSAWQQVGDALYLAAPGDTTNEPSQITDSRWQVFSRGNRPASFLEVRMRWSVSGSAVPLEVPEVRLFARSNIAGVTSGWQFAFNSKDEQNAVLDASTTGNCVIATGQFVTYPSKTLGCVFPVASYNEFLFAVVNPFTIFGGGSISLAALDVRFTS